MIGSLLYSFQESMIFHPWSLDQDHSYAFRHDFEEIFLESTEGAMINAIHFKVDNPKGAILYFHGNAGHLQRWGEICEDFVDLGYDLLVIDYRGFGKSIGPMSENALYEDGLKAFDYLLERYEEQDIIVYGRSLGSSVASKVASVSMPRQLILETPFYNLYDVAKTRFPIYPIRKLLKYKLPNNLHLQYVNCPVAILHGTNDYVVPFKSGKKLAATIDHVPLKFTAVEGGGHNNLHTFDHFRNAIKALLE